MKHLEWDQDKKFLESRIMEQLRYMLDVMVSRTMNDERKELLFNSAQSQLDYFNGKLSKLIKK